MGKAARNRRIRALAGFDRSRARRLRRNRRLIGLAQPPRVRYFPDGTPVPVVGMTGRKRHRWGRFGGLRG